MGFIQNNNDRQVKNYFARHKNCTSTQHVCKTHTYLSGKIIRKLRTSTPHSVHNN
jgi:hypothetical protein